MPSTPLPVVLATLALRRRLKQLADKLVPPQIAMLDLGEGVGSVQIAAAIAELGIADVLASGPMSRRRLPPGSSVMKRPHTVCSGVPSRATCARWTTGPVR
ncbi:hypothetical protein [Mycolicibacterium hippocampi]|uniref:Uncharacterized protein n=1 Tax=Mycolicibacterium hippocampi TaxID=659824 RepID=A0A850PFT7_9MYCO|nr:hypothetical protein [Mycolicibacterium hippocampi]NVN49311.1 hypothetical protein [Mycolicibacterium hippocampi]